MPASFHNRVILRWTHDGHQNFGCFADNTKTAFAVSKGASFSSSAVPFSEATSNSSSSSKVIHEFACCLCLCVVGSSQCSLFSLAAVCGFYCDFFSQYIGLRTDPYLPPRRYGRRTYRPNFCQTPTKCYTKKASTCTCRKRGGSFQGVRLDFWVAVRH
jgi:hypothetical protein